MTATLRPRPLDALVGTAAGVVILALRRTSLAGATLSPGGA